VTLHLPVASQGIVAEREGTKAPARAKRNERLLVVDNDSDVRDIVGHVLAELGYDVREAGEGKEALAALCNFDPDLLVVDFAMPNMNGAEIVATARARKAGLKILFLSGYADTAVLEAAVEQAPLLHKPFRPAELAAAVRTALDSDPARAEKVKTSKPRSKEKRVIDT
jgi:CheY-like chemotaxis protein